MIFPSKGILNPAGIAHFNGFLNLSTKGHQRVRLVTELVTIFKRSGNFRWKIAASFVLLTYLPSFFSFLRIAVSRERIREIKMVLLLCKTGFVISGLNRGCLRFFLTFQKVCPPLSGGQKLFFQALKTQQPRPKMRQRVSQMEPQSKSKQNIDHTSLWICLSRTEV